LLAGESPKQPAAVQRAVSVSSALEDNPFTAFQDWFQSQVNGKFLPLPFSTDPEPSFLLDFPSRYSPC
jgi:hypothetical protein